MRPLAGQLLGQQLPPFVALRGILGRMAEQETPGQGTFCHRRRPLEALYECVALPSRRRGDRDDVGVDGRPRSPTVRALADGPELSGARHWSIAYGGPGGLRTRGPPLEAEFNQSPAD